jgi:hypothetical protein
VATFERERIARYVLIGMFVIAGGWVAYGYWSRPPQMGRSEEVFRTVDALYTAIRSKDAARVDSCEARLNGYRDAGKLPASAANRLSGIIGTARAGSWQTAAERLYDFMLAQQRAG